MKEIYTRVAEGVARIGTVFVLATASGAVLETQRPFRNAVSAECVPTIGLEPQIIGSIPHFITPPNCYTLMGEPAQPDGFPLVISPVRW